MELVTPQLGVCILYNIGVNFTWLSPGGAASPFVLQAARGRRALPCQAAGGGQGGPPQRLQHLRAQQGGRREGPWKALGKVGAVASYSSGVFTPCCNI